MTDTADKQDLSEHSLFLPHVVLPWHSRIIPMVLAATLLGLYVALPSDVMQSWALSRASFRREWGPLVLHLLAHGSLLHVLLNAAALAFLGPRLIATIGSPPISWARFIYIFLGSGLSGGVAFLLINEGPYVSAVGASGALFGVLGALARVHPSTGVAVSVISQRSWLLARTFLGNHALMFLIIFGAIVLTGQSAMVAWEAHLGGMLFGLFAAPLFLPSSQSHP